MTTFAARLVLIATALVATSGCVSVRYDVDRLTDPTLIESDKNVAEHHQKVVTLANAIRNLDPAVSADEAAQVADIAVRYPLELAQTYRLTSPPITHNILVNMGARPRGLCTHWAEDLLRRLHALELETLDLYWGVAFPTRPWRLEHSSAVVVARGQSFDDGIVLDAWRNSGKLFFAPVAEDTRYAWERLHNMITDPPPPGTPIPAQMPRR